jgi:hypothetical protein
MFKEAATKITKFVAGASFDNAPIIENGESIWVYGILFVNSDPSFPSTALIYSDFEQIRSVTVSPASSYELEVPYLSVKKLRIILFAGVLTVYVFHSSGGA